MKQYFTGFFTGACLVASAVMFMGASNKNLGDITVNSITVRTADGKEPIYIGYGGEGSGYLKTYNADGIQTAYLGTAPDGSGKLHTSNKHGVDVGYFGANKNGDGMALLYDRYGDIGWSAIGKK